MTWKDVTVGQFQQLQQILQNRGDATDLDLEVRACSILYGKSEQELDSMGLAELDALCRGVSFFYQEPLPEHAVRHITVNGRRYRFIYDVRQIKAARYIEVSTFQKEGVVENLHRLAASMVVPQRRTWYGGWVDVPYDASRHREYAQDMQQAPIIHINGAVVFFCKVFAESMRSLQGFLIERLICETNTSPRKAVEMVREMVVSLDGFTKP